MKVVGFGVDSLKHILITLLSLLSLILLLSNFAFFLSINGEKNVFYAIIVGMLSLSNNPFSYDLTPDLISSSLTVSSTNQSKKFVFN